MCSEAGSLVDLMPKDILHTFYTHQYTKLSWISVSTNVDTCDQKYGRFPQIRMWRSEHMLLIQCHWPYSTSAPLLCLFLFSNRAPKSYWWVWMSTQSLFLLTTLFCRLSLFVVFLSPVPNIPSDPCLSAHHPIAATITSCRLSFHSSTSHPDSRKTEDLSRVRVSVTAQDVVMAQEVSKQDRSPALPLHLTLLWLPSSTISWLSNSCSPLPGSQFTLILC